MTKKEIINELHKRGCWWANESYSKAYLKEYLDGETKAKEMTLEELEAYIKRSGKI